MQITFNYAAALSALANILAVTIIDQKVLQNPPLLGRAVLVLARLVQPIFLQRLGIRRY